MQTNYTDLEEKGKRIRNKKGARNWQRNKKENAKQYAIVVTLDVQNALNPAPWEGIDRALRKRKVAGFLRSIICRYMHDRILAIEKNKEMEMTCGVPQGSVLGPTLWNIYYASVFRGCIQTMCTWQDMQMTWPWWSRDGQKRKQNGKKYGQSRKLRSRWRRNASSQHHSR